MGLGESRLSAFLLTSVGLALTRTFLRSPVYYLFLPGTCCFPCQPCFFCLFFSFPYHPISLILGILSSFSLGLGSMLPSVLIHSSLISDPLVLVLNIRLIPPVLPMVVLSGSLIRPHLVSVLGTRPSGNPGFCLVGMLSVVAIC